MVRELPLFPLPIVLFPGATQPLHIFEPRYRQMLTDCLEGDPRFGITYTPAEAGATAAPAPGDVGCMAHIVATHALPDGRSDIVTTGERRFVLQALLPTDRPYRLARVEEFDDEPEDHAEAEGLAAAVRQDFVRLEDALSVLTDRERESLELPADPTLLSFRVAAALELEPAAKLVLLALRNTTARLRRLAAVLSPLAADAERRATVRHRARRNGKGGAKPQIEHAS